MASENETRRLSAPGIYLVRIIVFLLLIGFVALILYRQIQTAFMANPGLNGLIIGVLCIGIVLAIRQVWRLIPEVRWVNTYQAGDTEAARAPVLLAPMAKLLGDKQQHKTISTMTLRAILDSIGSRLDESREIARYLTGLLVFLGLLGTFWGLLETVGSISNVIKSMQGGNDAGIMFDELKNGLSAPIAGMSISFTSSLFGLAGSLVLGFLDLQAGQAQNRFYNELEDFLSANATDPGVEAMAGLPPDLAAALTKLSAGDPAGSRASTAAMANLAEGIQGLVKHMRGEQQMIRDWVEAQAAQQREISKLLERIASEAERR
ncbi:flagellar motor protein MotA [Roseiarcaceae bacterium H3SJ34-1]|uniref:flagellar motor protein MotA n=1 Tax=Terripilifer ovatus TaxID=3032367 RepID=UPI003AB989A3|nr:flagellar motor protein MotA [Roseiarcaceae bacterium H3SJ34-1]